HRISFGNHKLRLQCLEIREKSVLVKADGETQPWELTMGESHPVTVAAPTARDGSQVSMTADQFTRLVLFVSGIFVAEFLFYLSFSWSCRQLCRRAGHPSSILVWLPGFKQLALFRAMGVSWLWFFLGMLI